MDEVKRERRCENCIYWDATFTKLDNGIDGWCHKYPPDSGRYFPMTHSTDFCGEHRLQHPKDKL